MTPQQKLNKSLLPVIGKHSMACVAVALLLVSTAPLALAADHGSPNPGDGGHVGGGVGTIPPITPTPPPPPPSDPVLDPGQFSVGPNIGPIGAVDAIPNLGPDQYAVDPNLGVTGDVVFAVPPSHNPTPPEHHAPMPLPVPMPGSANADRPDLVLVGGGADRPEGSPSAPNRPPVVTPPPSKGSPNRPENPAHTPQVLRQRLANIGGGEEPTLPPGNNTPDIPGDVNNPSLYGSNNNNPPSIPGEGGGLGNLSPAAGGGKVEMAYFACLNNALQGTVEYDACRGMAQ